MIKQSHVDAASKEAAQEKATGRLDRVQIPSDILPAEKQKEGVYNVLFKLVKKKRGRHWLDNFTEAIPNPENNNMPERMCLLAGATDVWESKCENIIKDKNRYDRARRGMDIMFVDGVLRVRSTDVLRLKFLRLHPKNVGDRRVGSLGSDFYEYSPAKENEDRKKKIVLKMEIGAKVMSMPDEQARKLASFLGIPMVDELGMPVSPDGIKADLAFKVDADPATVQRYIDSREVEISWMVKRAIIDNKIDLGGTSGNAMWSAGKGFIAKIPSDKKPYTYLTELAMTNSEDGRRFLEQLKTIVT
jgi:hypothetical protein